MKKLFIIAAAACVTFASCVKNDTVGGLEQGDLITFEAPVVSIPTKATEYAAGIYDKGASFDVYAWYSAEQTFPGVTASELYINEIPCVYHDVNTGSEEIEVDVDYFAPETSYYWPKSGYLSFFALSPASTESNITDGKVVLSYTADTDVTKQVDLLYSDWATGKNNNTGSEGGYAGVDISFNHALSVVKFYFKGASADVASKIQITNVTLQNVKSTGTLTCDYNAGTPTAAWSAQGTPADYELLKPADYLLTDANTVIGTHINNEILIPQTIADNVNVVISYNIKSPATGNWIEQVPVTLQLNTAKVGTSQVNEWVKSTKYSYTIVFDLEKVYFAPVVKDFVGSVTATDIQK